MTEKENPAEPKERPARVLFPRFLNVENMHKILTQIPVPAY